MVKNKKAELQQLEELLSKLMDQKISSIIKQTIEEIQKQQPKLRHGKNPFSV